MTPIVGGAVIATVIAFITGLLALLSQEGVNSLSDISDLSLMILTLGAFLTFFKDFQSIWTRKMLGSQTGTNAGSPWPIGILAVLLAVGLMSGCSGTRAAYDAASGLDETAKVVSEHYYATVRELNDLAEAGVLTGSALADAQDIVRSSAPAVIELGNAARAWNQVRSAENQVDLERAISSAAIAVSRLVDVIKARQTSALDGATESLNQPPLALAA